MSEYNRLESGSFVDYESGKSFEFDHVAGKPSGWENYTVDSHVASTMYSPHFRGDVDCSASISKPLGGYVLEHYPALPAYAVYPPTSTSSDQETYTIIIVGNKYNNSNFWSITVPPIYSPQLPFLARVLLNITNV